MLPSAFASEREVGLDKAKTIGLSVCLAIVLITSSVNRPPTALKPEIIKIPTIMVGLKFFTTSISYMPSYLVSFLAKSPMFSKFYFNSSKFSLSAEISPSLSRM
jgi:hypothetical protein